MYATILIAFVVLAGTSPVRADVGVDTTSADHPLVPATRVAVPPTIDGVLDDAVWASTPRLTDFHNHDLDRSPKEPTVVQFACDSAFVYVAARCCDSRPAAIRAEQSRRGGSIGGDDIIAVCFDPVHGHRRAWEFYVNPIGTQGETVPGGSANKVEWRGDWLASTRIDTLGWTAEMAIPLAFFNRPPGAQIIGIAAFRHLAREDEWVSWPNMGKGFDVARMGDLLGVEFPKVRRRPAFMPFIVPRVSSILKAANPTAGTTARRRIDPDAYLGLDAKYTSTGGIVYVGTLFPDFQNVEAQVLNLDFSYSEINRSDSRPFFQEGAEFLPGSRTFYTRRVAEMYGGLKVFGERGSYRIGAVEAYDRNGVNHTAAKWGWRPGARLTIEQSVAWRHGPRGIRPRDDVPLGTDHITATQSFSKSRAFGNGGGDTIGAAGGMTYAGSDSGRGHELWMSYNRWGPSKKGSSFQIELGDRSGGFMPADGLLSKVDTDMRQAKVWLNHWRSYDRRWFRYLWASGGTLRSIRHDGELYRQEESLSCGVQVARGTGLSIGAYLSDRPPYEDRTANFAFGWNGDHIDAQGSIGAWGGRLHGTDYFSVRAEQGVHPFGPVTLRLVGQYVRQDYPVGHADKAAGGGVSLYQVWATAQYDITPERSVSGRIIYSSNGTNGYLSYRQMLRRGMDLFLIVGDPSAATWKARVALKAVVVL